MRIIEDQVEFRGYDSIPAWWRTYFSKSKIGTIYNVIRKIEYPELDTHGCNTCNRNDYIYSDTEYQKSVTSKLFEACEGLINPKILVVGYGMGEFIPHLESIGSDLTILEKYHEVLEFDEKIDEVRSKHRIIIGDHDTMHLSILGTGYDIIFIQIMSQYRSRKREMEAILSESGTCIYN